MKKLLPLLASAVMVFAADSSRYREDFHYSYPQTAGGRLSLENFNGSVEITGWDQNNVDISGTKYAETPELLASLKIEVSSSGNEVQVRTVRPDGEHRGNLGAKYVIRVPRRTGLQDVTSSNGSLKVEDIEGDARLRTSNGSVHLSHILGNVDAHSSNGSVESDDIRGRMSFRTSNGGVHAQNVEGTLEADTSNGGIHVHLKDTESGHPIKLATSNGAIELQLGRSRQNDIVASTSNGPITVRLPSGSTGTLHAATNSSGSIRTDFEILMRGEISRRRIDGTIGGGGPRIELTTSNGNINLLRM